MSDNHSSYHEQQKIKYTLKLRELCAALPPAVGKFLRSIEFSTEPRTRIAYAIDLKTFFEFLQKYNPVFGALSMRQINFEHLSMLTSMDVEEFLEYLKVYIDDKGKQITNNEQAIKRKLCALRSFYNYLYKAQLVTVNPAIQVNVPKMHEKAIIRLDPNETAELLDHIDDGIGYSNKKTAFRQKNRVRNLAIITLLLGTGMRISECVGIDLEDIDFDNDRIKITRKGGYESFVYFGNEVREALQEYLLERNQQEGKEGSEHALFLSSRLTRMTVRNIEIMVKDYSKETVKFKKITPHKLRSTYGTTLYQETRDIYLVADVLGHKDVNTTRKHYANMDDDRRRSARNKVTLREKTNTSTESTTEPSGTT